jgi:hypothetical protein
VAAAGKLAAHALSLRSACSADASPNEALQAHLGEWQQKHAERQVDTQGRDLAVAAGVVGGALLAGAMLAGGDGGGGGGGDGDGGFDVLNSGWGETVAEGVVGGVLAAVDFLGAYL